jgi:asparagine synthase (glutamine-hydrolysing)
MCGIACVFGERADGAPWRARAIEMGRLIRHRGPDWSGVFSDDRAALAHERLAIVDVANGAQPLTNAAGDVALAVNGEIYNHAALRRTFDAYPFKTSSDCEVILPLYERDPASFLNELSGIFAFAIYDARHHSYLIARDPIGVMPLYTGRDEQGTLHVASELKALAPFCRTIEDFPPGHYLTDVMSAPVPYYKPSWTSFEAVRQRPLDLGHLRASLEAAVERQLMSDVPYGVLISGGLDSSLIASCARRFSAKGGPTGPTPNSLRLHSFSIGLEGSPDVAAARLVAQSLETHHHEMQFTIQEGLDALRDVIYHVESYDVTTIRASTPMYLMARRIRSLGIKMVLSGEGADEVFGGYLYFHRAPNDREFHEETVRKLLALHKFDCLRANKSMAAWGVEVRVPFLDREFLDVAMGFAPREKMTGTDRMEKYPLRKAFDRALPPAILWRQKEQFSDGVGYAWIDSLKAHAEERVTSRQLSSAPYRFSHNTPVTKEAYLYRELFESCFGDRAVGCVPGGPSIACSSATAVAWDPAFAANADPSGRAVRGVHNHAHG